MYVSEIRMAIWAIYQKWYDDGNVGQLPKKMCWYVRHMKNEYVDVKWETRLVNILGLT